MIDVFLVPENTVVTAKGDSEPIDVSPASESGIPGHAQRHQDR